MEKEQVYEIVKEALVEAIGLDEDEISPDSTIMGILEQSPWIF